MIGRTNVGGRVVEQWYAAIDITTDSNAVITAVNPRGNSYSKQADSSGSVIIHVSYPGTYTISETDATSQTVIVADYGVVYPVSIYRAFTGKLIENGSAVVPFAGEAITNFSLTGKIPTITNEVVLSAGTPYNCIGFELSNGAGMYLCQTPVSLSGFSKVVGVGEPFTSYSVGLCAVEEGVTGVMSKYAGVWPELATMATGEMSFSTYGFNTSKKYRFGVYVSDYGNAKGYIHSLKLV